MSTEHQKVKLSPSTWVAMFSLLAVVIGMTATLSVFVFETSTSAAEHKGDFVAHVEKSSSKIKSNSRSIRKSDKTLQNVRDNLIILMTRQGLKRKVKPLDEVIINEETGELPID